MSVSGIEAIGGGIPRIGPLSQSTTTGVTGASGTYGSSVAEALTGAAGAAGGTDFASALGTGVDNLQRTQTRADDLAIKAATGDLTDAHDYMIASTEANLATQLTTAVRNRAVEAFQEIMRMQG